MSDPRQLPLFPSNPDRESDLNRYTPIVSTLTLFQQYLVSEGKTVNTVKAFIADMRLLLEHADEQMPIGKFQTQHLNAYLNWMENGRGVSCSRKTYARRVTTLKVYFKWLKSIDAISHDPAKAIVQRSGEAPLSYALNHDEIQRVIAVSRTMKRHDKSDTRPELLFLLLLYTGIKKSEAMGLVMTDIHRDDPTAPYIHVYHTSRNVYKERKIPIEPDWFDVYDEYRHQYDIKDKVFTCTARNLEYVLSDLGEAANVPAKISFEVMRWTSAVRDYRAGVDPDVIREKLGLSRITWAETGRKIERLVEWQDNQAKLKQPKPAAKRRRSITTPDR